MLRRLIHLATRPKSLAALTAIAAAGLNVLLMLAFTLVLAPALDAAQFGAFSSLYAAGGIGSTIVAMGVPLLLQRMIPAYVVQERWGAYGALLSVQLQLQIVLGAAACLALATYAAIPNPLHSIGLAATAAFFASAIALGNVSVADIRCHGYNLWGTLLEKIAKPALLATAAIYVAFWAPRDYGSALTAIMLATFAGSGAAFLLSRGLRRPGPAQASARDWSEARLWREISLSGVFVAFVYLGINRLDLVILGVVAPADTVGEYAIAQRVTEMISLPALSLSTFITPLLSASWAAGQRERTQRLVAMATLASMGLGISVALVLLLIAEPLFTYLGASYSGGIGLTYIVAIGQLALAAVGPAGAALVMTGHHRAYLAVSVGVLSAKAIGVYLGWLLAGAIGAAFASAACILAMVVIQAAVAFRLTGLVFGPLSTFRFLKPPAGGMPA